MSTPLMHALAALLCGCGAGLATRRLLLDAVADARDRGDPSPVAPAWLARPHMLALPLLLGAASAGLSLLPGLHGALALSQALLLLYLLVPLALVDLLTLTVEPALVLGGLVLRLAVVLLLQREGATEAVGGMLAGAGLLAIVGFAYHWLRGREGLGEGDPLVLALIGAFVGWRGLLPVVLVATSSGLVVGALTLPLLRKPLGTPLPFAPFLCLGGLLVYLAQTQGWWLFGLLPPLD